MFLPKSYSAFRPTLLFKKKKLLFKIEKGHSKMHGAANIEETILKCQECQIYPHQCERCL